MEETRSPLQRSVTDRKIAGVLGGLASYLGWDPTVVRLVYVALSILSIGFPGVMIYLVMWIVIPEEEGY
jgi:phage shock protein C